MRLVAYDKEKLGNKTVYKKSNNLKLLEEFAESDMDCAKIEDVHYKNANSAQTSLYNSIRRYHMTGIKCVTDKGEVFLVKVEQ